jgi:hypothetical protein
VSERDGNKCRRLSVVMPWTIRGCPMLSNFEAER